MLYCHIYHSDTFLCVIGQHNGLITCNHGGTPVLAVILPHIAISMYIATSFKAMRAELYEESGIGSGTTIAIHMGVYTARSWECMFMFIH